jgi:hypothetical protein
MNITRFIFNMNSAHKDFSKTSINGGYINRLHSEHLDISYSSIKGLLPGYYLKEPVVTCTGKEVSSKEFLDILLKYSMIDDFDNLHYEEGYRYVYERV